MLVGGLSNSLKILIGRIKFILWGILTGIIIVGIVFFILNYLGLIKLPEIKISPSQYKAGTADLNIESKSKKTGYSIIWQGDENDTTGRTILTSRERGFSEKFGFSNNNMLFVGLFEKIATISGTKDAYLTLKNPLVKDEIISIRIKTRDVEKVGDKYTDFEVSNLSLIANSQNNLGYEFLFEYLGEEDTYSRIKKIIRKGDIIEVWLHGVSRFKNNKEIEIESLKDDNDVPVAAHVAIRRFDGGKQIEKELNQ